MASGRREGQGQSRRQIPLCARTVLSAVGLSSHLCPEYLKELKCKSQKLNPWVPCTQEEAFAEQTELFSFLVKQPHTGGQSRLCAQVLFEMD